jgi:hypothetical protein
VDQDLLVIAVLMVLVVDQVLTQSRQCTPIKETLLLLLLNILFVLVVVLGVHVAPTAQTAGVVVLEDVDHM